MREIGAALSGQTAGPTIAVHTKSDLVTPTNEELATVRAAIGAVHGVAVSAESGLGLDDLLALVARLAAGDAAELHMDAPIKSSSVVTASRR